MLKLMLDSAEYTQFSIAMTVKDEEKGTMINNVPYFYIQNYGQASLLCQCSEYSNDVLF